MFTIMPRFRRPTKRFSPSTPHAIPVHDLPPAFASFTYIERRPSWGAGAILPWVFATFSTIVDGGMGVFVALPVVAAGQWLLKYGKKETAITKKKVDCLTKNVILLSLFYFGLPVTFKRITCCRAKASTSNTIAMCMSIMIPPLHRRVQFGGMLLVGFWEDSATPNNTRTCATLSLST